MANLLKFPSERRRGTEPSARAPVTPRVKAALTELRVERLKATGRTHHINDAAQPGLSVRVSAAGAKAFVFTKFKHGKFTQITLGRVGALRLDDARRAAQKLHGEIAQGIDITARARGQRARQRATEQTMQDAFERFMSAKTRRPSTIRDYQSLWLLHTPAPLKRKPVSEVTAHDIEHAVRAAGKQHRTANKLVMLIGAIMAKSGRWADNPARGITRHAEHPRTRRLSMDELARVWAAASAMSVGEPARQQRAASEHEKDWTDFFRLLILTGARRSPFQAMRWQDLNLDAGVWLVPVEWSKNKRELAVPLSAEATRILRERMERTRLAYSEGNLPWVFPSADSATGHVINPVKAWRRLLKAAGVHEHTTLHDVRRTLGSRLAMDGVAGATISKVLGHVSAQSLKHYLHLDVTAGSEAIDRLFAGVITSTPR
jgi:integrase